MHGVPAALFKISLNSTSPLREELGMHALQNKIFQGLMKSMEHKWIISVHHICTISQKYHETQES
jgi:hypothetical protein